MIKTSYLKSFKADSHGNHYLNVSKTVLIRYDVAQHWNSRPSSLANVKMYLSRLISTFFLESTLECGLPELSYSGVKEAALPSSRAT
jgi:hypothetical protein